MGKRTLSASKTHNSTECAKAHLFLRVPLFNLSEAGRGFLTSMFYPRLRSLRSLSLGILRIKPRRGFALAERNTIMRIPRQVEEYNLRNMCYRYDPMQVYQFSRHQLFFPVFLARCKPEERRLFLYGTDLAKLASKQVGTGKKHRAQPLHHSKDFTGFCRNKMPFHGFAFFAALREEITDVATRLC